MPGRPSPTRAEAGMKYINRELPRCGCGGGVCSGFVDLVNKVAARLGGRVERTGKEGIIKKKKLCCDWSLCRDALRRHELSFDSHPSIGLGNAFQLTRSPRKGSSGSYLYTEP